ncbi:MAG: hypothetical protein ACLP5H_11595 [Desulfomonilaceae bacterium]
MNAWMAEYKVPYGTRRTSGYWLPAPYHKETQSEAADLLLLDTGEPIGHLDKVIAKCCEEKRRHSTTRLVAIEHGVLGIPEET